MICPYARLGNKPNYFECLNIWTGKYGLMIHFMVFCVINCGRDLYLQSRLTHLRIFMIMVPR